MGIVMYSILGMVGFMSLLWHWVYCEPYTAFQSINSCRILGAGLNGFLLSASYGMCSYATRVGLLKEPISVHIS